MKKLIYIILIIIGISFVIHWTGLPLGTYIDMFFEKVFAWTNNLIPRLTDLIPKLGNWVKQSIQSFPR